MMRRRTFHHLVAASAASAALPGPLFAQATPAWPTKPVRLVVPFPPGGSTDLVARFIAQGLGESLGQTFIVDNRSGAGGNVGTDAVAKAAPDGYTFGLSTSGPLANNRLLYARMPFDAEKDLAPVALVGKIPLLVACHPDVPARDLRQLLKLAKAQPEKISVGHPGNGTIGHLALAQLALTSGVTLTSVPYRGDTPALQDLMAGTIQALVAPLTAFIPSLESGRIRGLAVTSPERYPGLQDIPTAKEQGIDLLAAVWFAIVAPAGVPPDIVTRVNAEVNRLVGSTQGRARLQQYAAVVSVGPPDLLRRAMAEETQRWRKLITDARITLG